MVNQSSVTMFMIAGLTGGLEQKIPLFIIVLLTYIISLLGNAVMLYIICVDNRLHTPMYYFLWNLSLSETLNITNFVPFMLAHLFSVHTKISMGSCFTQSFLYVFLATVVFFLMPIMSYDRYVAICNPLRYTTIMSDMLCLQLIITAWFGSFLFVLWPALLIMKLPFCGPNIIKHFYCDIFTIMSLACGEKELIIFISGIIGLIMLLTSLLLTTVSYVLIIYTVLQIQSTQGRQKAFSTCSSHLTMVIIIYVSAIFVEVSPTLNPSIGVYQTVNMFSSIVSPLMNPFVYTFRNENVKQVVNHLLYSGRNFAVFINSKLQIS